MDQPALWTPAVAAFSLHAHWEHPSGWVLVTSHRREGEPADSWSGDRYEALATDEVLDVAQATLGGLLGHLEGRWQPS